MLNITFIPSASSHHKDLFPRASFKMSQPNPQSKPHQLVPNLTLYSNLTYPANQDNDSWKDLAKAFLREKSARVSTTTQQMLNHMNQLVPFSSATSVFDVGCGSGSVISSILGTYGSEIPASAELLAGDFSPAMLEGLSQRKRTKLDEGNPIWDRLEIKQIDAHDLSSIESGSISHVASGHMYFLLDDAEKALRETYRVLCSGGVFGTSSGSGGEHIDALENAIEDIRPGTNLRMIKEEWKNEDSVKRILERAGFVEIETFVVENEMEYERHEVFADTLLTMPIMKDATADFDESEVLRLRKCVAQQLRKRNPDEPGMLKGSNIVALARKV